MASEEKTSRITIDDLEMVPATQAKNRFGELLHRVCYDKQHVLIERGGKPMAVVMDVNEYLELKRQARGGQKKK
ncbi:MAG: type II toxin-antitoxin system prevent-host-death family antitoxin [Planctomycetota bacterium]|nr:type II toxin-antitoxin system prevent-host-death family antitoxin [Planctomycetota bacterium]MDA1138264.1 type II toxin-antitoxin system prevent-host-death family antitoxin [Planctomycetota bacterium]